MLIIVLYLRLAGFHYPPTDGSSAVGRRKCQIIHPYSCGKPFLPKSGSQVGSKYCHFQLLGKYLNKLTLLTWIVRRENTAQRELCTREGAFPQWWHVLVPPTIIGTSFNPSTLPQTLIPNHGAHTNKFSWQRTYLLWTDHPRCDRNLRHNMLFKLPNRIRLQVLPSLERIKE